MAADYSNLVQMLKDSRRRFGNRPALGRKTGGRWRYLTYEDIAQRVDSFRGGLAQLGVKPGDRVGIIANNGIPWVVSCYGTLSRGACFVAMYPKQRPADWEHILADSDCKVVVVESPQAAAWCKGVSDRLHGLRHLVTLTPSPDAGPTFDEILELGQQNPVPAEDPEPDALCTILYTSGTTGAPKGVELTHRNIVSNVNALLAHLPVDHRDRALSFLPWAHALGQTAELHLGTATGGSLALAESIEKIPDNLREVRPTILIAVPRMFNRIYDQIHKRLKNQSPRRQRLFARALAVARRRRQLREAGHRSLWVGVRYLWYHLLVFRRVKQRLGGRLRCAVSAGAALSLEVARFISDLGIVVYEGYGLSETSPVVAANVPGQHRLGTAGRVIEGVEVRIDHAAAPGEAPEVGEILVRGPNVMRGYRNLPELTAQVIDSDGFFHTGDLGFFDEDQYLHITGRIKEQYKLENGKYVVPGPMEERLQLSLLIEQAMVYGDNQPYNVALIVPDREGVQEWATTHAKSGDFDHWIRDPDLRAAILDEAIRLSNVRKYEQVRDVALVGARFTVEEGLLTPTLKLRRREVLKRYGDRLQALYER